MSDAPLYTWLIRYIGVSWQFIVNYTFSEVIYVHYLNWLVCTLMSFSRHWLLLMVDIENYSQNDSKAGTFHFSGCLEAVCNLRLGAIWEGRGWNVIPVYSLTQFQHSLWNRTTYWIYLQAWCVIFCDAGRQPEIARIHGGLQLMLNGVSINNAAPVLL